MRPLLLLPLLLVSCASGPIVKMADGTQIVINPSLFERTAKESAAVILPNGVQIAYSKEGKDQTSVANMAIGTWGTVQGIIETAAGLNEGEAIRVKGETARALSSDSVKKADIAADQAIRTFVPHTP